MKRNNPCSRMSRGSFLRRLAVGVPLLPAAVAVAQSESPSPAPPAPGASADLGNLRAFFELARSDIRTQKALIIAENIPFTEDEAIDFWPVHREYDFELNKLLDERYLNIMEFAKNYASMRDRQATVLAGRVFDVEEKRTSLKRKYFKKFTRVIPAVKAARFFQIENQLNMVLDLQIAGSLPLIK